MSTLLRLPASRPRTVLIAALSLSIGWGIRGNFGHEYGAMIPGALTAIAVCLMAGREDWRERVAYFGMFGALGWGFGGSISYMQVISYTHSGHLPSQIYGFFCLFVIGFLWGGMGGAGTAFPAVADRERLTAIFRPLIWVFGAWAVLNAVLPMIESWESSYSATWSRHESLFYWFDSDWLQALTAILGIFAFDLWDRRQGRVRGHAAILAGAALFGAILGAVLAVLGLGIEVGPRELRGVTSFVLAAAGGAVLFRVAASLSIRLRLYGPALGAIAGAMGGLVMHAAARAVGQLEIGGVLLRDRAAPWFVQYQGDMGRLARDAGEKGLTLDDIRGDLLLNWPQFFQVIPQHLGWIVGAFAGICVYFRLYGRFRSGASLFLYMGFGWLIGLLLFPTLLGFGGAGMRMTPPRGDDWAGILGVFLGTMVWCWRNGLVPVVYAALVSGAIGGLGFSGAAWIKLMLLWPGNASREGVSPESVAAWKHWHSANWHSFLEQTYGFINGIGIAVAMLLLAARVGAADTDRGQRRWTGVFAAGFVLFLLTFLNISKNVTRWVEAKAVPEVMTMPLFESVRWSAETWFLVVYAFMSAVGVTLMIRHQRRPIAAIPASWLGRGQLFYLVFLWMVVVANFERALPGFSQGRIITEGVIFMNAILATYLILTWPPKAIQGPRFGLVNYETSLIRATAGIVAAALFAAFGMTGTIRLLYGDSPAGHARIQKRFGPEAEWRVAPLLKGKKHS